MTRILYYTYIYLFDVSTSAFVCVFLLFYGCVTLRVAWVGLDVALPMLTASEIVITNSFMVPYK